MVAWWPITVGLAAVAAFIARSAWNRSPVLFLFSNIRTKGLLLGVSLELLLMLAKS
jgi:hypothetical protein